MKNDIDTAGKQIKTIVYYSTTKKQQNESYLMQSEAKRLKSVKSVNRSLFKSFPLFQFHTWEKNISINRNSSNSSNADFFIYLCVYFFLLEKKNNNETLSWKFQFIIDARQEIKIQFNFIFLIMCFLFHLWPGKTRRKSQLRPTTKANILSFQRNSLEAARKKKRNKEKNLLSFQLNSCFHLIVLSFLFSVCSFPVWLALDPTPIQLHCIHRLKEKLNAVSAFALNAMQTKWI